MLESTALNWDVFDDDCRQYLATHPEQHEDGVYDGGVYGGEQVIRRDDDFNQLRGGRPKVDEADSEVVGRRPRENVRDEISRCQLIRPHTNWYCSNNCVYEE